MTRMDEPARTLLASSGTRSDATQLGAREGTPSFEQFFEDHHAALFRALWLVAGNRQEAEEIMQDAFLRLWERWDRVAAMTHPTGYLYRTGMNVFRSRARRARVAILKTLSPSAKTDPISTVEERDALVRHLSEIPPRQRAAIVLVDALGFTSEEAATAMSIRPPTVRVLVARARESLRNMEVHHE
jgi:RNA polymerase sigma-70 factor, ECF subfamily